MEKCSARGDTIGSWASGFVGSIRRGWIKESFSTGDVSSNKSDGQGRAGGLVNHLDAANIYDSYATGNIYKEYVSSKVGGLVAQGYCGGKIYTSYATGKVSTIGTQSEIGSIMGGNHLCNTPMYDSYAINEDVKAFGKSASNLDNYCSYEFDSGCNVPYIAGSIKTAWSDSIWENLADLAPKLEWENSSGTVDSVLLP